MDLSRDHQQFAYAVMDDLVAWLRAIGLEPDDVPVWARPKVADGQFGCEVYLRRDGKKYFGEDGNIALGYRSVEMSVPPSPAVRIWIAMCEGKTLTEAINAVYRAGREDAARDSVIISAARDPAWTDKAAEAVLLAHLRRDIRGCLCGWAELGKSHPGHQVAMLRGAGLLSGGDQPRTVSPGEQGDNPEEQR